MRILVVLPAYNEDRCVDRVVPQLVDFAAVHPAYPHRRSGPAYVGHP